MKTVKFKFLEERHLSEIMEIQKVVVANLPRADLYYQNYETVNARLKVRESVVGAYCGGKLVGFHVMDTPDLSKDILGEELGWPIHELSKVVKLGPVAVHPDYRGQNIITHMVAVHLDLIRKTDYRHVVATVSPFNYPSLKYLFSQGFLLRKITFKYHDLTRFIMHLDLKRSRNEALYRVKVEPDDVETQKFLLSRNFYGFGLAKTPDSYEIIFSWAGEN